MKVKKGSRILQIDDSEKSTYLSEGYDVVELDKETNSYEVVEEATGGKTYSIAEYKAVSDELKQAKATIAELELALKKAKKGGEFDRKEALAKLAELGIEHKGNDSNDKLKELLETEANEGGE
ncbi:hypothetical protein [Enterococcus sp. 5H]|uniref:hypothetical protein n=1 Tax=Enterococcus sp. 5H TaxID=1229490 RepID=UPI0023038CD3|nr:hypothetical protein [Enterococcus sp. 5H]MDA9472647.1 hypothetical protein [Enterococcus sp. 5H]